MQLNQFDYSLPEQLIAQAPLTERTQSRLLVMDRKAGYVCDTQFASLLNYLNPGDALVVNDTRVIPARLYGHKSTGGQVEILIERVLNRQRALACIKASNTPKAGTQIYLADEIVVTVVGRENDLFILNCSPDNTFEELLEQQGHMPLPPYIQRPDDPTDEIRYQTVYARHSGAAAAPTAGLHFDETLLHACEVVGIELLRVTLHVGVGTFQPVRVQDIRQHVMHREWCHVSAETVTKLNAIKQCGGRIIAVGTTSVRCLETSAQTGRLQAYQGETQLFIYPGYRFQVIDGLITNFHLPQSSLLMLVSAFAGYENTMQAYQHAIQHGYRFFSYGDAMLILDGVCQQNLI